MNRLVFDVESIGLYGPPFAYGYVVLDKEFDVVEEGGAYVSLTKVVEKSIMGLEGFDRNDINWVSKYVNVMGLTEIPMTPFNFDFYKSFYQVLENWHSPDVEVWADCCYPVETNFLARIFGALSFDMLRTTAPYPLLDIATAVNLTGVGVDYTYRTQDEMPAHNPLCDAKQSSRILAGCIWELSHGINGKKLEKWSWTNDTV